MSTENATSSDIKEKVNKALHKRRKNQGKRDEPCGLTHSTEEYIVMSKLYDFLSLDEIEHKIDMNVVNSLRVGLSVGLKELAGKPVDEPDTEDDGETHMEYVKNLTELSNFLSGVKNSDSELIKMLNRCVNPTTLSVFVEWLNETEKLFNKYNYSL